MFIYCAAFIEQTAIVNMKISRKEYYSPHKCNSSWIQEEKTKRTKQKKQKRRGEEWDNTERYSEEIVKLSPSQQKVSQTEQLSDLQVWSKARCWWTGALLGDGSIPLVKFCPWVKCLRVSIPEKFVPHLGHGGEDVGTLGPSSYLLQAG